MKRIYKPALWVLGFISLAFLILYPIQQYETTWDSWSLPLSGKVIVIDAGHGGVDGGAEGSDDTQEKDIALIITKNLKNYLQQAGALVYLTRDADEDLAQEETKGLSRRKSEDIRNRLAFIEEKEADFFVTVHLNALVATQWRGAQTFYYPSFDENKHLATFIQSEIIRNLENTTRTPLAINGVYLLKHAKTPGALVEVGFLSNPDERELLKQDHYQQQMSASIYEGILRYVTEEAPEENQSE